uniref:SFRICE_032722 n=1 Tax=Spodoptera frugiperda TaxID=7108 RepID=A0A2H1W345_SPOFR
MSCVNHNLHFQLKWMVQVLVHYEIIVITSPSITGVTYMDNFDFEERYRDVNECNPFHWHPLHLPPYCVEIFEKLIRSRLASNTPVRIAREREKGGNGGQGHRHHDSSSSSSEYEHHHPHYPEQLYQFPYPLYQITSDEYESYSPSQPLPMSPYEKLMKLLREDIKKDPSSPTVTVMPSLGPVALYNQAISQKSVNLIRELAEAYVKATKEKYDEYYSAFDNHPMEPQIYVYDSAKNKTNEEKAKKKSKKDKKKENEKKEENDNKNKVYKLRTKHGGVVTIIETRNVDMMKKDSLFV